MNFKGCIALDEFFNMQLYSRFGFEPEIAVTFLRGSGTVTGPPTYLIGGC